METKDFNEIKDDLEVMLEALDGIVEPRRITVMHSVGEIHITIEVCNFDVAIYDNDPVIRASHEGK